MSDSQPSSLPAIFLSLVIALVAVLGGVYRWGQVQQDFDWTTDYWVPKGSEVEIYLRADQRYLAEHAEVSGEGSLIEAFRAANLASHLLKDGTNLEEYRFALTRLEENGKTVFQRQGAEAFRAVGLRQWKELARALKEEQRGEVQALGANFLDEAQRAGLKDVDGQWSQGAWLVMRMLFMARWSTIISQVAPRDLVLHSLERKVIPAWKAEAHADMKSPGMNARLKHALRAGEVDGNYPVKLVQGIIYLKYGLMHQARPLLEEASTRLSDDDSMKKQIGRLGRMLDENAGDN